MSGDDPAAAFRRLQTVGGDLGYVVVIAELQGTANGDCNFDEDRIRVRDGLEPAQQVKTLAHELGHAVLHNPERRSERPVDRNLAELEAESVAYIACHELGFVVEELKTPKSRRIVPLMDIAIEALRMQQEAQVRQQSALGEAWHDTEFVFTSDVGTPLDPANVRHHYYQTLDWADMPKVRLHDLRHTASTLMASEGIPVHVIQAIMGHTTSVTTMDVYTHVLPASYQELTERMNAAYARVTDDL